MGRKGGNAHGRYAQPDGGRCAYGDWSRMQEYSGIVDYGGAAWGCLDFSVSARQKTGLDSVAGDARGIAAEQELCKKDAQADQRNPGYG